MLQNQHFKCQRQRLGYRWARVRNVLQDGLTTERKAITHHLVPVMAPQLLWHSLSPVILGHRPFFFFSLSALICSRWNCDSLVSTSNTKISFPRVTFSSTSFVYSVDGYYVSQGQVQVWMFVHFNLLYVGSLISHIKWCETGINKGWEQN